MGQHLTALDATFLELEEREDSAHMHIGGVLIFDPLPGGGVPSLDQLRTHLAGRLGTVTRYGQRLSAEHTGGLRWPEWVDDHDFDIARHVERAALPPPGGDEERNEWLGDYWSHRLDRRRPLWDMVLLEGLEGGRWAIVTKTHHCMVDGVSSMDIGQLMLDVDPEGTAFDLGEPPGDAGEGAGLLRKLPGAALNVALHPHVLRDALTRSRALAELIVRDEVIAAPGTSLNEPIGTLRAYDVLRVPLDDLRAIRADLGGTVNDVALAAASGGLRRLLVARGEQPPSGGIRAMVPMNIRSAAEQLGLGNRVTSLFVELPVDEGDPLMRYERTVATSERLKRSNQALGAETAIDVSAYAPPVIHSLVARSLYASRLFNVTITNVPGPQQPLYAFGAQLRAIDGLVPLAARHGVGIAVVSCAGEVSFGLVADRDGVPDLAVLRDGIGRSMNELRTLAGVGSGAAV